jgi:hypothetical protein
MKRAMFAAIVLIALGGVAAAEGERATVSWSPAHLVLPLVEMEAEFNVVPNMGLGLIAGVGSVSDASNTISATAYELGAQANYYFMKPFSGLHAGVEGLYLTMGDVVQDSSVSGEGLSIGPYIGYKLVTSIGFTFVAQGGVAYLAMKAQSSSSMTTDKTIYPLLNLNIGWSF